MYKGANLYNIDISGKTSRQNYKHFSQLIPFLQYK